MHQILHQSWLFQAHGDAGQGLEVARVVVVRGGQHDHDAHRSAVLGLVIDAVRQQTQADHEAFDGGHPRVRYRDAAADAGRGHFFAVVNGFGESSRITDQRMAGGAFDEAREQGGLADRMFDAQHPIG